MSNTTKKLGIVVIALIVLAVIFNNSSRNSDEGKSFTVGAILPLTGPASLWGETFKNGMEMALAEKTHINVLYEDSKSTAQDGISAFNILQNKDVDLMVSELSLVAVPISKVALQKKIPLFVSLVATNHSTIVNDYTTRYYTDPTNYATPAFIDPISPVASAQKIAILNRNDELGVSVKDEILNLGGKYGKQIVLQESFTPNEKDYRTVLTKVKNSGADALIFVVANPLEAVGIVKMAKELNITIPLVESSAVFADLETRKQVEGITFYSTSYDFSLPGKAESFKEKYRNKFRKEPNFGAAFGYDVVNLISTCVDKGKTIKDCLSEVSSVEGVAGVATQVAPGDFVVKMHVEKVN